MWTRCISLKKLFYGCRVPNIESLMCWCRMSQARACMFFKAVPCALFTYAAWPRTIQRCWSSGKFYTFDRE